MPHNRYAISALLGIIAICNPVEAQTSKPFEKPKISARVSGPAKVISSGILEVDGKRISLVGVQDLDEPPSLCLYLSKYLPPGDDGPRSFGPAILPPSLDTPENRNYCSPRVLGKNHLCSISMTAADQYRELTKIADGKNVTCDYVNEEDMGPLWDHEFYVSKFGYRFYPGECFIEGQSVGARLIATGWAGPEMRRWKHAKPVDPTKDAKRLALKAALKARDDGAGTGDYPRVKSEKYCFKDHEWEKYPERYSPKPPE